MEHSAAEGITLICEHHSTAAQAAQLFVPVSFDDFDDLELERLPSAELKRRLGLKAPPKPAKPRRAPQAAAERQAIRADLEVSLVAISGIEAQAGPTLSREIAQAKTSQAAYGLGKAREAAIIRRRGHRKGLLRLLVRDAGTDYPRELNDRSRRFVELMLRITANLAVLEDASWEAASTWFERHLPVLVAQIGDDQMRSDFDVYLAEAARTLAGRVQGGAESFIVEPRPRTIANALQLTIAQLRDAEAAGCGLAAIDTPTKRERDRERKERKRREMGMVPQAARTKTATLKALASEHGCSLRTLQRRQEDGTLEAYLAERSGDVTKVSAL